jgi:hypothetical protein
MTTLTFKVRDEEAATIRRQAKAQGVSVSELLRRRVIIPETRKPIETVICEYTGARIFKGDPSFIPLTTESVKEMLADFP